MIHNLVCNKEDNEHYYRKKVVRRARFELVIMKLILNLTQLPSMKLYVVPIQFWVTGANIG